MPRNGDPPSHHSQRALQEGTTPAVEISPALQEAEPQLEVESDSARLALLMDEAGRVADAVSICQRAITETPDDWQAYVALGQILTRSGDGRAASLVLRSALAIAGHRPEVQCSLAEAFAATGKMDRALSHAKKAVELSSLDPLVLGQATRLAQRCGDGNMCVRWAQEWISLAPKDAEPRLVLAERWQELGRTQDAIGELQAALQLSHSTEIIIRATKCLVQLGARSTALKVLRGHAAANPGNVEAQLGLGELLEADGSLQEAIEVYQRAVGLDPRAETHFRLARALHRSGAHDRARSCLLRAAADDPNNTEIAKLLRSVINATDTGNPPPSRSSFSGVMGSDLSVFSFAEMLEFLKLQRATGVLSVASDQDGIGTVHFYHGGIVWIACSESLSLRAALVSVGCHAEIAATVNRDVGREPVTAKSLITTSLVDPAMLQRALFAEAEAAAAVMVGWKSGTITFERQSAESMTVIDEELLMDPQGILLEVMRKADEQQR